MLIDDLIFYDQEYLKPAATTTQQMDLLFDFFDSRGIVDGNMIPFLIRILKDRQRKDLSGSISLGFYLVTSICLIVVIAVLTILSKMEDDVLTFMAILMVCGFTCIGFLLYRNRRQKYKRIICLLQKYYKQNKGLHANVPTKLKDNFNNNKAS